MTIYVNDIKRFLRNDWKMGHDVKVAVNTVLDAIVECNGGAGFSARSA